MNKKYKQQSNESDYEYGLRLITTKVEEKPDDLEWGDVVELLHLDIHRDTLRKSVVGSPYSGYAVMKYFQEHNNLLEIKKATIQMRDERNELNKMYREISRSDKVIQIFKDIIVKNLTHKFDFTECPSFTSDNDMVVLLSDIHYGIGISSYFNKCDKDIIKERLEEYLASIREIRRMHNSQRCYLVLGGDLISGAIHSTIRIANIENVVTQIKEISVLLSSFVYELSTIFDSVHVYETPGNHSRLFPQKDENQKGDLLDTLVPCYLQAALQNQINVVVHTNDIDPEICSFEVRGHTIMGAHGDKDTPSSIVQNMTKLSGQKPDIVVMGHKHTNGLSTVDNVKLIQNGSLCGMDNYATDKRLLGTPEQICFVVSSKRLIAGLYDLQF